MKKEKKKGIYEIVITDRLISSLFLFAIILDERDWKWIDVIFFSTFNFQIIISKYIFLVK